MPPTLINPKQINLRELFSVERVLSARGMQVENIGLLDETMLGPDDRGPEFYSFFFLQFSNANIRHELLRICENEIAKSDAKYCADLVDNLILDRQRFSNTLEWFIGELLVRNFNSFSSAFGVRIKKLTNSKDRPDIGDFDVLSVLGDASLIYVECKSGATDAEQIRKASQRGRLIGSVATVVALGRKSAEISVLKKLLKDESHHELGCTTQLCEVASIGLPDSKAVLWGNTYFLPISSPSLENSFTTILRLINQQRAGNYFYYLVGSGPFGADTKEMFRTMGFELTVHQ